jgi:hypothetical protein
MVLIPSFGPVQSSFANALYVASGCHLWIKRPASYINRLFMLRYSRGRPMRWSPAGPKGSGLALTDGTEAFLL